MPHARTSAVAAAAPPPRPRASRRVDLRVLADVVGAELAGPRMPASTVTGVTLRAAEVRPGDLFAALPGARAHGADFAGAGAAPPAPSPCSPTPPAPTAPGATGLPVLVHPQPRAVLGAAAATVYGDPTQRLRVLGVTGTSGKTTVAHLLEAGLAAAGRTTGLLGTVGIRGRRRRTLPSAFTTPEAPDLQALFAVMRGGRASRTWRWRSPATRSRSAGSPAPASPSAPSPTCRRTTSTSTPTWTTTSPRRRRCSRPAAPSAR